MRFVHWFNNKTGYSSEPEQCLDLDPKIDKQCKSYYEQQKQNKLLRAKEILDVYHNAYKYKQSVWEKIRALFRA